MAWGFGVIWELTDGSVALGACAGALIDMEGPAALGSTQASSMASEPSLYWAAC